MKNIHIRRFATSETLQGVVEPEDGAWLVLIDAQGDATFWRRCREDAPTTESPQEFYIDAELPGNKRSYPDLLLEQEPAPSDNNPLDFRVEPAGPGDEPGFFAFLNARHVASFGGTEHEAIRRLLNYAVRLAVAGCLDYTGAPMPGHSKRRYDAAFPPDPLPV